ncbi:Alkaline phosphatase H like protein [Verticillium longisporum]|nr:Alkaline phosphatase H like protein [Verticillium longisporum]
MALEDFIEKKSPPILSAPPTLARPLHAFTGFPRDTATIMGPRRCTPVKTPVGNGSQSLSIWTSTGASTLAIDTYAAHIEALSPDIAIAPADLFHTSVRPPAKKLVRMADRTEEWVARFLKPSRREKLRESGTAVFAPILGVPHHVQWQYLKQLSEDEIDALVGLAIYDVELLPEVLEHYKPLGTIWGAVSTAFIADATPIALTGHTRARSQYGPLIEQALNGISNYSWPSHKGPDVYFGGGAEQFIPGSGSYKGKDYYAEFANQGYTVSQNKTALEAADSGEKALGIFCKGNLPTWLDRNVYTNNLQGLKNSPAGGDGDAKDLPGLKEMTLKAIDVLHNRASEDGFFLMSEAASIDKQMHALDYDRALGDLLELDDTVRATIAKLKELGILDETLIVVSADHGHGFEAEFGSTLAALEGLTFDGSDMIATAELTSPLDWMSLIILLDQITRNCFRDDEAGKAYGFFDERCLQVALEAIKRRIPEDPEIRYRQAYRFWFYMPLEHSESMQMQDMLFSEHKRMFSDILCVLYGLKTEIEEDMKVVLSTKEVLERSLSQIAAFPANDSQYVIVLSERHAEYPYVLTPMCRLSLSRYNHTVTVIEGKAYMFGGQKQDSQLCSVNIHALAIPTTGVAAASEYACYPALAMKDVDTGEMIVPVPRTEHAACARGHYLVIHGGRDATGAVIDEDCIWLWDSRALSWSRIQAPSQIGKRLSPRYGHHIFLAGKEDVVVLHGGRTGPETPANMETWLFTFDTLAWTKLPSSPAAPMAAAFVDHVLYTVSRGVNTPGAINFLDIRDSAADRERADALEWQTVDYAVSPLTPAPKPREGGALVPITTGVGRNYLIHMFGHSDGALAGEGDFYSDIWSLQVPSRGLSAAALKDAIREKLPRAESGEFSWAEIEIVPEEKDSGGGKAHPGPRALFGAAAAGDANLVFWGGINGSDGGNEEDSWLLQIQ